MTAKVNGVEPAASVNDIAHVVAAAVAPSTPVKAGVVPR